MTLPSGVSTVFPTLFLSAGVVAWIYSQMKRRSLMHWYALPASKGVLPEHPSAYELILAEIRTHRSTLDLVIERPSQIITHVNPTAAIISVVLMMLFVCPIVLRCPWTPEGRLFDVVFWSVFLVLFGLVTAHALQLIALWKLIKNLLRQLIQLPLCRGLDRLPRRLHQWFFMSATPTERELLVLTHVENLVAASDDGAKQAILRVAEMADDAAWQSMRNALADSTSPSRDNIESTRTVFPIIVRLWKNVPAKSANRRASKNDSDEGASDGHLPAARYRALSNVEMEAVDNWIDLAENLLAIQIVRWLAPSLSQLWILVRFLVIASISLLFAINSYPFPQKGHVLSGLGLLIGVVALIVGGVLVAVNRDEFISRVSKTTPNQLTFDSTLVGPLFAYVLPLIGIVAAISLDVTDVVRVWLGPIVRVLG